MSPSYEEFREFAAETATIGGRVLTGMSGAVEPSTIKHKDIADWVSEADRASERAIIERIRERYPKHAILTEEAGSIGAAGKPRFRWIVDPLDGTTNFLRGMPVWAVSVALEERRDDDRRWGRIIAGAVHVPPFGETFSARLGGGAYRNGGRLTPGEGRSLRESLLGTGFPFRARDWAESYFDLFTDLFGRCADVRRAGAVAVDLCWVAAGVFDGFWELDLQPWDLAAGALIITEAGGRVSDFQGGADFLTTGDIVAGHPKVFGELLDLVRIRFPEPRPVDKFVAM